MAGHGNNDAEDNLQDISISTTIALQHYSTLSNPVLLQEESPEGGRFKKEIVVDGQSYLLLIRDEGGPPELQVIENIYYPEKEVAGDDC